MPKTLTEIANELDELHDVLLQLSGAIVEHDQLEKAGIELRNSNGELIDLRSLARDLRARDA